MDNIVSIDCELRIYGLRRTGNHAIINWILRQSEGISVFYNDTLPEDPYSPSPRFFNCSHDEPPRHISLSILSFEDRSFRLLKNCENKIKRHEIQSPKKRIDILIMRDPFNLFASRKRSSVVSHISPDYHCGLTLPQIALEYIDAFVHQCPPVNPDVQAVFVNFNLWKSDKSYRESLANQLGLTFTDKGWFIVSKMGGGSSFDKTISNAENLELERRWEAYAEDTEFHKLFRDPSLIRLARLGFAPFESNLEDWITKSLEPVSGGWRLCISRLSSIILPPIYLFLRSQRLVLKCYRNLLR